MIHRIRKRVVSLPILRSHLIARQFVKFTIIGVVNTAIDFFSYLFLTRAFDFFREHFLVANLFAFLLAVSVAFVLNRRWTFRDTSTEVSKKFVKFFLVYSVGFGINQTALSVSVLIFGFHDLFGKLIALCANLGWNFLMTRHWTFRHVPKTLQNE
ncbi:MAG: GtrA family protein [Candidatus Kerfeldbacteria bacterium]|nr:GtrA family protein [Candidatus Kerfeldbacteria bacterium]